MSSCLESIFLLGQAATEASESWPDVGAQWVDALMTPVSFVILGAGFLGLLVGFLVGKGSEYVDPPSEEDERNPELEWRHEKLILLERQREEEQLRRARYVDAVSAGEAASDVAIKSRYFALAELLREERQRAGGDLSRFELLDERLAAIEENKDLRPDAVAGCREIAQSRIEQLKECRDSLRSAGKSFFAMEADVLAPGQISEENKEQLSASLEEAESQISAMPVGWQTEVSDSDRKVREILAAGGESQFDTIRSVLLIDGAETASLKIDENRLSVAVAALKTALESGEKSSETPENETAKIAVPDLPEPDEAFVEPEEIAPSKPANGFHGPTNGSSGIPVPESDSEPAVIFRSNNAELWGKDVYRGANSRARALSSLPKWAKWISIARVDTGERVFAPADSVSLQSGEGGSTYGFNGTNELFYGARHLGIFAESCPNEVETRFTYGGWGFGHRVKDADSESNELQASGWEGREIDADTVFEISLYADLPDLEDSDKVLDVN